MSEYVVWLKLTVASSVLADDRGEEKATLTYRGRYQVKNEITHFFA